MKRLLGVVIIIAAIVGGVYFGGWVFFFNPIQILIQSIMNGIFDGIAFQLFKIFICAPATEYIAVLLLVFGIGLCSKK